MARFMKSFSKPSLFIFAVIATIAIALAWQQPALASNDTRIDIKNIGNYARVAPGESLPISVKLSNFGSSNEVDITVNYGIFDTRGHQIYTTSETVAVQTTASYIKTLQIPLGTPAGNYIARTSITYQDQLVP